MTTATLSPSATLDIGPYTGLRIIEGSTVSLDVTRTPYASASVTVALADIIDRVEVDPRGDVRAIVHGTDGTTPRDFDLSVQTLDVDDQAGTVTFGLESDEALVQQYVTFTDRDELVNAFALADVVGFPVFVATGEAFDFADNIPITALSPSENLIRNPRMGTSIIDWTMTGGLLTNRQTSGGPSGCPTYFEMQAGGSGSATASLFLDQDTISTTPGKLYVLSVWVRAYGVRQVRLLAQLFDDSGNTLGYAGGNTVTPAGSWVRISASFYGGARVRPSVNPVAGLAGSEFWNVTGWRLSESTGDADADALYFDGATTDTTSYDYSWADEAHASVSRRAVVDLSQPTAESLIWKAGDSGWRFIIALLAKFNRRVWCDEERKWYMMNPDTWSVSGTLEIDGLSATQAGERIELGNTDEYASGVFLRHRWTGTDGQRYERVDTAGDESHVRVIELDTPYPGPGAADAILARMDGRGSVLDVTALADFTATPGMTAQVTLPGEAMRELAVTAVEWQLTTGLMRVQTRALI